MVEWLAEQVALISWGLCVGFALGVALGVGVGARRWARTRHIAEALADILAEPEAVQRLVKAERYFGGRRGQALLCSPLIDAPAIVERKDEDTRHG